MRQSLSWIDRDALRDGLRDLAPVPTAHPLAELGRPASATTSRVYGERPLAQDVPAEFTLPLGPIHERLEAFVQWAGAHLQSRQVFLVGQEGLCLAPVEVEPQLVLASTWVMDVWQKVRHVLERDGGGTGVFQIAGGTALVFLIEQGSWGTWGLGAIISGPPDPAVLLRIQHALLRVIASIERD
ncbi:MAG TPA: hypothetical protein PLP31_08730 [Thermoanaerobaculaceae bacterium]|nr:hypothetical protein [Thermoanaerobaculaceae bacterium]